MELTKKDEFIEVVFTGKANGTVFDTNNPVVLKEIDPKATPRKWIVAVGAGMVISGLDKALEGKEPHKDYIVSISANEGFGPRQKSLIRTIPLRSFTEQKVFPQAGMTLSLDGAMVRISAVSGSRVIADFNHPLAGKDLSYEFTITRKVDDVKERTEAFFSFFLRFMPEFDVNEAGVVIRAQKELEPLMTAFKERFEQLVGKTLHFQAVEPKPKKEQKFEVEIQQSL